MEREALNSLVAHTEALEKRLWGGEPTGGSHISQADLSQVLKQIGRRYFLGRDGEQGPDEPLMELTETVNQLIEERAQESGGQVLLSIRHAAVIQLVENLFRYLEYSHDLDPAAFAAIRGLQICMARMALTDLGALTSPSRPLRQFMELSLRACQGCDSHAGFRSQELLAQVRRETREVLTSPLPPEQACYDALQDFDAFLRKYERESPAVEQVMIDKERNQAVQEQWQQSVRAQAFGILAGKRLPKAALEFFDQIWSEYLLGFTQWEGADGQAWDQGVEAVHALVGSLGIRDPEQMLACYSGLLTEVLEVFRRGAEQIRPGSPLTRDFIAQMEAFCLQVVDGEGPNPAQMIDVPGDAYDTGDPEVSDPAQLAKLKALQEGAWYLLQGRGIEKRGKLVQNNQEDQYCLFVNYSGIKAARLNFRQIIEGLEEGSIRPVEIDTVYDRALQHATERMEELIPYLQSKVEEAEAERQRLQEEKLEKKRQAEKLRRLQERKRREAEAARKKARVKAAIKAKRQAEQRAEAARLARERALELARSDVARMQVGGRLELVVEGRPKLVCELGVRLKSSQKMVFVDQFGRKQLALLPEELAERIAAGDGRILDFGATFDDTLRSLIVEHSSKIPVE